MEGKIENCQICGNHHSGLCSYQISYFTYYPQSQDHLPKTVELVGQWYRWQNHQKMNKKIDMKGWIYYAVGSNVPIGKFQYKFVVDGKWTYCKDAPTSPDPYGSFNNYIEVLPKKALVQYCSHQDIKLTSSLALKDLKIIGSWDNWVGQTAMELAYNNLKGCQQNFVYLELIPNMNYEFKFKYNDIYLIDDKYPTVTNQFGSLNNRIFICSEKINTPTYLLNKSVSSTSFSCRSFQWEKFQIQSSSSEYKWTLDGHSMCQIGEYLYIFGGRIHRDFTNKITKVNIHKLNYMKPLQILPNERAFHYSAAYGNKMIIYGGHNKVILHDYHTFNTTDRTWAPSPQMKGRFPPKRQKQSGVLYKTLLVLFGGYYCSTDIQFQLTYNDIQVLDIEEMKWIDQDSIKVNGSLPQPRFSQASALIHSNMYIFGGRNVNNTKGLSDYVNYNDLWVMDLNDVSDLHWQQIKAKGNPPAARYGHTMNALHEFLLIFGGEGQKKQRFNDVVVFDTEKAEWIYPLIKCKTLTSQPVPRVYHAAASIDNQYIIIFGGKNINEKSTSFYVLKPKDFKIDLDIEQQQEISGTQSEGNMIEIETPSKIKINRQNSRNSLRQFYEQDLNE